MCHSRVASHLASLMGMLTLLPELVAVWRIQEQMLYCLFKHTASQAVRDAGYAYFDTAQVARSAIELFEKDIDVEPAAMS